MDEDTKPHALFTVDFARDTGELIAEDIKEVAAEVSEEE